MINRSRDRRYYATNPKRAEFIRSCQSMAKQILGDNYDEEITKTTAEGIWDDYSGETFDAKLGIFRNGLRGYKRTKEESKRPRTFSIMKDNSDEYGKLIGTLLQSAVISHLYHFQTKCRFRHEDMQEYYENIVDLVDNLSEAILEPLNMDLLYANMIDHKDDPIEYFEELKAYCMNARESLFNAKEDSLYASMMDDIIAVISKTLYKLKRFNHYKGESEKLTKGSVSFSKRSFSKKDRWEMIGDKIINGELKVNLPDNLGFPLESSILEYYINRYENLTDQQIVDIICNDMVSGKVDWVKDYYYSKRSKKYFSNLKTYGYVCLAWSGEPHIGHLEPFWGLIEANNEVEAYDLAESEVFRSEYTPVMSSMVVSDQIGNPKKSIHTWNPDNELKKHFIYLAGADIDANDYDAWTKREREIEQKYLNRNSRRSSRSYSKKYFSSANGVKPAPQRMAVIFIPKDNKLACNATYKEPDMDPVSCWVPQGGYGLFDGDKFIENMKANKVMPLNDNEIKIVPIGKVKVRGRIGRSSSSI